jgi:glutaredoxin
MVDSEVKIYSLTTCGHCKATKRLSVLGDILLNSGIE